MRRMISAIGAASLAAALLGVTVFAAQRDGRSVKGDTEGVIEAQAIPLPQAEPRILSYEGPGVMDERYDGLLVFARDNESPWAMSFDLQWDRRRVEAADAGQDGLLDLTGDLKIVYDPSTNILKVHAIAGTAEVFEAYWLNPKGLTEASRFEAYVDEFFAFMHTGQSQDAYGEMGTIAEGTCPGGSCSCVYGQY